METNLNGLIIDGKVYAESRGSCKECDLKRQCMLEEQLHDVNYCQIFTLGSGENFRFSPELTEKLKGE